MPPPPETTTESSQPAIDPFKTPVIEPRPNEPPPASSFMADVTKAFNQSVGESQEPEAAQVPPATTQPSPPVKPAEPLPEAEPPQHFTPKAKDDWRKRDVAFKAEIKAREERLHELQAELEKSRKGVPDLEAELARTRATLAEREAALERFDVERSPLFKEKVLEAEESVRSRLLKNELAPEAAKALLEGGVLARERILEDPQISSYRKGQIIQLLDKWDEIQETRRAIVANGKRSLADYERQQKEAENAKKAQFMREAQSIYEDQCVQLMPKLEAYQPVADNKEWNEGVNVLKSWSRKIYSGELDRRQLAEAAIYAPAALVYRSLFLAFRKRCDDLQTQVNKLTGVTPSIRDSGGDTQVIQTRAAGTGDFVKDMVERFNKEALP
jgi:hypothetical protein